MPALINPSILSADFMNLERELQAIAAADFVHVDVMDNHFVPNLTLGLPVVKRIAEVSPVPLDVHLMIEDADRWAPEYAALGAASVTFHAEATQAPVRLARELRSRGVRAGIALRPASPVEPLLDLLPEFDMILVMTVEPGFGGQSFIEGMLPKIRRARQAIAESGASTWIQVDGGVARDTIGRIAQAGANVFVAGSAVYGAPDVGAEIVALRELADANA
ncbi:ribulose-phosphate 3-epimerase [Cellulomonas sp. Leaf334]|uniref:ribulose-phosphate 3-epimerase n=1 Tax=Cellulomonas sp. Leaf334 TaxID=1736339 RepID=UPI0006F2F257|nr:ribulose-phosphate 3-epimerase [Cellulomonas sp. Leaf334]KQR16172.1 ribulose phosphate epimerase [Cellulomonas sp. Leaf334]